MDAYNFYIVLVKAFIRKGDKFLLAQRALTELQKPGAWSIPGGKVDFQDNYAADILLKTLKREVREEVGINVKDNVAFIWSSLFTRDDGKKVIGCTFLAEYDSGVAQPLDETNSVKWLTLEELENLPGMESFLQQEVIHLAKFIKHIN